MPITPRQTKELYADFFKDFTENPVSLDLARKTNEEAVKESIRNLLLTDKGERVFQPNIGGNIRRMLFDNITPASIVVIKETVKSAIESYEPRATVIGVDVFSGIDDNNVTITVVFYVINSEEPITLATTIDRIR